MSKIRLSTVFQVVSFFAFFDHATSAALRKTFAEHIYNKARCSCMNSMRCVTDNMSESQTLASDKRDEEASLSNLWVFSRQLSRQTGELLDKFSPWLGTETLTHEVKKAMTLKVVQHSGISAEMTSRLHLLMQLTIFWNFLDNNADDSAFGEAFSTSRIRHKIRHTVCTLKTLVGPHLSKQNFTQDIGLEELNIAQEIPTIRREVMMTVIKFMNDVFNRIEVVRDNSVILVDSM